VKVSIACPAAADTSALRERARQIAAQLPARTPERRAAAACWAALSTTGGIDAARRALTTFGSARTQADAAALIERLAVPPDCAVVFDLERSNYLCSSCGAVAQ
jgi:hypothetical protein